MRNSAVFSAMALLFIVCHCSDGILKGPRVYITGDEKSIGAEIYVDGEKIGEMIERTYTGPPSGALEKGDKFAVGVRFDKSEINTEKDNWKFGDIRVPSGLHEFKIVSKDGRIIEKEIKIEGETYLGVDFEKMKILGDSAPLD